MLKNKLKCRGEACIEKIEDIAEKIFGVAFLVTLVVIYTSFFY